MDVKIGDVAATLLINECALLVASLSLLARDLTDAVQRTNSYCDTKLMGKKIKTGRAETGSVSLRAGALPLSALELCARCSRFMPGPAVLRPDAPSGWRPPSRSPLKKPHRCTQVSAVDARAQVREGMPLHSPRVSPGAAVAAGRACAPRARPESTWPAKALTEATSWALQVAN